jgi:hypothetical protein
VNTSKEVSTRLVVRRFTLYSAWQSSVSTCLTSGGLLAPPGCFAPAGAGLLPGHWLFRTGGGLLPHWLFRRSVAAVLMGSVTACVKLALRAQLDQGKY